MAGIGTSLKFIKAEDMGTVPHVNYPTDDGTFLNELIEKSISCKSEILKFYVDSTPIENLSIHNMICNFFNNDVGSLPEEFIDFCQSSMTAKACQGAFDKTLDQADCPLWHNLRYARVTASNLYEAAHCKTTDGSLVEKILGAKVYGTKAMERGKTLEPKVLKVVEAARKIKFKKCGLILWNKFPIFGASPDAMGGDFIVEVKCPMKDSTMMNYLTSTGEPTPKVMAQIQLQMYFAQKTAALYCVANPDFETSKKVMQCHVRFDEDLCKELIVKSTQFWCNAVFSRIKQ